MKTKQMIYHSINNTKKSFQLQFIKLNEIFIKLIIMELKLFFENCKSVLRHSRKISKTYNLVKIKIFLLFFIFLKIKKQNLC